MSLLLHACQCGDHSNLWRHHRQLALQLRRSLLTCAAWIFLRHQLRFRGWPWRLALLVDERLNAEERERIATEFLSTPVCCLDVHFGRKLRRSGLVSSACELTSPTWRAILHTWASRVALTNAPIEFRNAQQKVSKQSQRTSFRVGNATIL
jgi:hypothetical protein